MAVGDLYKATIHVNGPGRAFTWTQDFRMTAGDYGIETGTAFCEAWVLQNAATLQDIWSDQYELDQVRLDAQTNPNELPGFQNINGVVGNNAAQALPANMAVVFSEITDAPAARFNGRMYIPGIPEDQQNGGLIDALFLPVLNAFAATLNLDVNTTAPENADFENIVISRYDGGVKRPAPVGFKVLTNVVKDKIRQQRRRTTDRRGLAD